MWEVPEHLYGDLQDAHDGCPTGSTKVADQPVGGNPNKLEGVA